MQRAIKAVAEMDAALNTAEDCEKLDIGEKSIEKLQEIISTGEYRRNQIMAQDPHHRTVSLVSHNHENPDPENNSCMMAGAPSTYASITPFACSSCEMDCMDHTVKAVQHCQNR